MEEIEYKIGWSHECETICPYGLKHLDNYPIRVGTDACLRCPYFSEHFPEKNIIKCSYE